MTRPTQTVVLENIEIWRRIRRMSYSQLADHLKVHKSQITHLLKGNRPFRLSQLDKIAGAFDVPVKYLVTDWAKDQEEDPVLAAAAHLGRTVLFPRGETGDDLQIRISNALAFEEVILRIEAKSHGLSEDEQKKVIERFISGIESGKTDVRAVIKGLALDVDPESIPDSAAALPKKAAKKSATKSSRRKYS